MESDTYLHCPTQLGPEMVGLEFRYLVADLAAKSLSFGGMRVLLWVKKNKQKQRQ